MLSGTSSTNAPKLLPDHNGTVSQRPYSAKRQLPHDFACRLLLFPLTITVTAWRWVTLNSALRAFVLQCESKKSAPESLWHFFPNGWEFLVQILHAYYTFISTLDYKFLFNYLQLWRSYAILSATTVMCSNVIVHRQPKRTLGGHT